MQHAIQHAMQHAMQKLATVLIMVTLELICIFARFAPICVYILFILHNAKYVLPLDHTHVSGDQADDLIAMSKLFWFAMFQTTEGRWTVASWVVVSLGNVLSRMNSGM